MKTIVKAGGILATILCTVAGLYLIIYPIIHKLSAISLFSSFAAGASMFVIALLFWEITKKV